METDIYEAFSSFAYNDDQFELNFDDPDEQPTFEFADSARTGSTVAHGPAAVIETPKRGPEVSGPFALHLARV